MNCSRPKPCNSSPPNFGSFSTQSVTARNPIITRLGDTRSSTVSYYQHPALRGVHPFSLELAINHHRSHFNPRMNESSQHNSAKSSSDSATNSDVEMSVDAQECRDREIDLSLKPDSNHTRSSSLDEEKISTSPEHDLSFESSDSVEQRKGK